MTTEGSNLGIISCNSNTEIQIENLVKSKYSWIDILRLKSYLIIMKKNSAILFSYGGFIECIENPMSYENKIKWTIVFVVAFAGIIGPMGGSIMLPAINEICEELNTNATIVDISVGIYLLCLGIFPLWWSKFSETYGRRPIYLISFLLFFIFSLCSAVAPNISSLIIFRALCGGCSASVQAVGAGTISDIYIKKEMGRAMGFYFLGPLLGPFLAPVLGGIVAKFWGWRATQWVLVIFSGISLLLVFFLLPETLQNNQEVSTVSTNNEYSQSLSGVSFEMSNNSSKDNIGIQEASLKLKVNTGRQFNKRKDHHGSFYNLTIKPLHSLILLKYVPVLLIVLYSSVVFAAMYFFHMTLSYEYSNKPYNFNTLIVGLLYVPNSVSYALASFFGGRWSDSILKNYSENHDDHSSEARFSWNIYIAFSLFPSSCLIFGWSFQYHKHWVIPLIGSAMFGFASMLVTGLAATYLVDILPRKGATGVALNNLLRQIFAAAATFIADPLLTSLKPGILFSIIAILLLFSSAMILLLKRWGNYYRRSSKLDELYMAL